MGLDEAELIMDVELAFDLQIDESDQRIRTVGGLYGIIQSKLGMKEQDVCLSSVACFRLRRATMNVTGIERKQFRLHATLKNLGFG